jgi:hypothetical protein
LDYQQGFLITGVISYEKKATTVYNNLSHLAKSFPSISSGSADIKFCESGFAGEICS